MRNNVTFAMGTFVMYRAASSTPTDIFIVRNVGPTYANAALSPKTRKSNATIVVSGGAPRTASKHTMAMKHAYVAVRSADVTTRARLLGPIEKKPAHGGGPDTLTKGSTASSTQAHLRLHLDRTPRVDGTRGLTRPFRNTSHCATGAKAPVSRSTTPNTIQR